MGVEIKVGFCVAYDWYYLAQALPLVYAEADRICLSLDAARCSWAGQPFGFDEAGFRALVQQLDVAGKVDVYEDDFHRPELTPMQNENRQRQLMAQRLGAGGWHVQLDADEYFLNFAGFAAWLRGLRPGRPVNIRCPYITLFKEVDGGYLVVEQPDYFKLDGNPVATNEPAYQHGRVSGWFNVHAPFFIVHQSWARSADEIEQKIGNWGHKNDFDTQAYFQFWNNLSKLNYAGVRNFRYLYPETWPSLGYVPGSSIPELVAYYAANPPQVPGRLRLAVQNSIWLSRLRRVLRLTN